MIFDSLNKSYSQRINNTLNQLTIDRYNEYTNFLKEECKKIHHCSTKTIGPIRDDKYTTFWLGKDDEPQSFIEYIVKNISINPNKEFIDSW